MTKIDKRPLDLIAAQEATRYTISGVRVTGDGADGTMAEAVDGRRLARIYLEENGAEGVVPRKAWRSLRQGGVRVRRSLETQAPVDAKDSPDKYAIGGMVRLWKNGEETRVPFEKSEIERWPDTDCVVNGARERVQSGPTFTLTLNARFLFELAQALNQPGSAMSDVVVIQVPMAKKASHEPDGSPIVVTPMCAADPRDIGILMPVSNA